MGVAQGIQGRQADPDVWATGSGIGVRSQKSGVRSLGLGIIDNCIKNAII
jgi:hypothetical protein